MYLYQILKIIWKFIVPITSKLIEWICMYLHQKLFDSNYVRMLFKVRVLFSFWVFLPLFLRYFSFVFKKTDYPKILDTEIF